MADLMIARSIPAGIERAHELVTKPDLDHVLDQRRADPDRLSGEGHAHLPGAPLPADMSRRIHLAHRVAGRVPNLWQRFGEAAGAGIIYFNPGRGKSGPSGRARFRPDVTTLPPNFGFPC